MLLSTNILAGTSCTTANNGDKCKESKTNCEEKQCESTGQCVDQGNCGWKKTGVINCKLHTC